MASMINKYQYYYIQYIKSNQLIEYTGELFTDCNSKECIENQVWNIDEGIVWDVAETFDDLNYNGVWDAPNTGRKVKSLSMRKWYL